MKQKFRYFPFLLPVFNNIQVLLLWQANRLYFFQVLNDPQNRLSIIKEAVSSIYIYSFLVLLSFIF